MSSSYRPIPLIELVTMGQETTIQKLIDAKKCDVNVKDDLGTRPVMVAASNRNLPILKILVGGGARLDVEDEFKQSPLSIAKENGYDEITKYIEEILAGYRNSPRMK